MKPWNGPGGQITTLLEVVVVFLAACSACAASGWSNFQPSAAVVSEITVADTPYDGNQSPVFTRLMDGRVLIAWHHGAPTNGYARALQRTGSSFTPVSGLVLLNPYTPSAWKFGHMVVPLVDGGFGTFYGYSFGTRAQRFDNLLTPVGGEIVVPSSDTWPDAAVLPGGDLLLLSGGPNVTQLTIQRYDGVLRAVGSPCNVNQTPSGVPSYLATIAAAPNGSFAVAWHTSSGNIMARMFKTCDQPFGPDFLVNTSTGGTRFYPSLVFNANNDLLIAWHGQGNSDPEGIYMRRFNSVGAALGPEVLVNQNISGPQNLVNLAASPTGEVVLSWTGRDGSAEGVFARLYNGSGVALTDEFRVNQFTQGTQRTAAYGGRHGVLMFDDRLVFSWVGSGPSGTGIFVTTFTYGGTPDLISLTPTSGAGTSGTFNAVFRHPGGQSQHYLGYMLLLPIPNIVFFNAQGTCLIEYNRLGGNFDGKGGMRLINNVGNDWLGRLVGEPVDPTTPPLTNQSMHRERRGRRCYVLRYGHEPVDSRDLQSGRSDPAHGYLHSVE